MGDESLILTRFGGVEVLALVVALHGSRHQVLQGPSRVIELAGVAAVVSAIGFRSCPVLGGGSLVVVVARPWLVLVGRYGGGVESN